MNKIEEILNDQCGATKFSFHNNEGSVRDEYDVICAIKEFGKICFEAGRTIGNINSIANFYKYQEYEDFLKEIEDEI